MTEWGKPMTGAKSNTKTKDFYVYLHRRNDTNAVFYVGKGCANRAFDKSKRSQHWKRIANKHGYTIEFVNFGVQEWYAFEVEKELIASYGKDVLCNRTDGGDGVSGWKHTKETKKKIQDNRKKPNFNGKNNPFFGMSHGESTKSKLRAAMMENIVKNGHPTIGIKRPDITGSNHHKAKKVLCVETGMIFDCIQYATDWLKQETGLSGDINACVKGRKKTSGGMMWKYV